MFPSAVLNAADRLIAILMTLIDAVSPVALTGDTPTFPGHAARTLSFRLTHLITTLIRISTFGIRAPAQPAGTKARTQPASAAERPARPQSLPRHPGWLLAALPDIAPAIAADLAALLANPALATFLAARPTLQRTLQPILRSLGLTQSPQSPTPGPTRSSPGPNPQPPRPAEPAPPSPSPHPKLPPQITPTGRSPFARLNCSGYATNWPDVAS